MGKPGLVAAGRTGAMDEVGEGCRVCFFPLVLALSASRKLLRADGSGHGKEVGSWDWVLREACPAKWPVPPCSTTAQAATASTRVRSPMTGLFLTCSLLHSFHLQQFLKKGEIENGAALDAPTRPLNDIFVLQGSIQGRASVRDRQIRRCVPHPVTALRGRPFT